MLEVCNFWKTLIIWLRPCGGQKEVTRKNVIHPINIKIPLSKIIISYFMEKRNTQANGLAIWHHSSFCSALSETKPPPFHNLRKFPGWMIPQLEKTRLWAFCLLSLQNAIIKSNQCDFLQFPGSKGLQVRGRCHSVITSLSSKSSRRV